MVSELKENIGLAAKAGARQLFLRYGIGFLINIAGTIVIARKGGPELWGIFAVSQVVLTVFALLSHGCWGYLIQSETVPDRKTIGNCYSFQSFLSIAWSLLILVFSPVLANRLSSQDLFPLLASTVLGGFFYGWRYVTCGLSERNLQYSVAAVAELSDILTFNGIAVVLALAGHPYQGIVAGNLFRGVISTYVALRKAAEPLYFSFDGEIIIKIGKFSSPYTSFIALQWLPIYGGSVVAGLFLWIRDLGLLQLAYKTVEYPRVLVTIAFRLSMSVFSRTDKTISELQNSLKKILDILYFMLVPAMGLIVALSPRWVPVVYGGTWTAMSDVMVIIMFPHLAMAMMMILSSLMSAHGGAQKPFFFYGVYNILYWPVLIVLTRSAGFFGLPVTEWVALAACMVLIRQLSEAGIATNMVFGYLTVLLAAAGLTTLLWLIALHRSLTETISAAIIMSVLWFIGSPVRREIVGWVKKQYALVAKRTAASK